MLDMHSHRRKSHSVVEFKEVLPSSCALVKSETDSNLSNGPAAEVIKDEEEKVVLDDFKMISTSTRRHLAPRG